MFGFLQQAFATKFREAWISLQSRSTTCRNGDIFLKQNKIQNKQRTKSRESTSARARFLLRQAQKCSWGTHTLRPLTKSKSWTPQFEQVMAPYFCQRRLQKSINADATFDRKIPFLTKFLWRSWGGTSWCPKKFDDGHKNAATIVTEIWVPWF